MGVIWAVGVWRMGWFACGSPLGSPCRQGKPNRLGSPHAVGGTCRRGAKTAFSNTLRGLGCSKNGFSYAVFDKGIHQPPLFGAPKRLFAGRIPPLPYPLPPCSRGERAGVRGDSSSPRCFSIFVSTRCTLIRPNGGKNRPHFRTPSANPLTNAPEMGYNRGNEFRPHSSSSRGRGKGSGEDATSRNQAQGGENTKSVRRRRIPPHPNPLPPSSRGEREEGSGGINTKTGGDARWRG
jgi:hypothetical protein